MCFEFIRASIDSYSERYDAKCQQNRENGKRGGRPKKADAETVNQSETYKPIVNEDNRMESEKTERFNGNTNETENVGEKENRLGTEKTKRFEKYPNETEKTKRGKKNHDYDIDYDSDGDIITHTVVTEWKGGLGGNQAAEFLAWLESAFPAITMMAEPLTEEQARDILAKFSAEDINRIIAQIDNKGAYKNKSAYSTFASFVAHDFIIKSRKATTGRKYTYNNTDTMTAEEFRRMIRTGMTAEEFRRKMRTGARPVEAPVPSENRKVRNAVKTEADGVVFDSRLERYMHDLLKSHGIGFMFQKRYTLQEPFTYNGETIRAITYTLDFYLPDYDMAIDTKGVATQQGKLRIKMLKRLFADLGRTTTIELPRTKDECAALVARLTENR